MSTIYICDGCGIKMGILESSRFSGSKKLRDILFCSNCFKDVEDYVLDKFNLEKAILSKTDEQIGSQTN